MMRTLHELKRHEEGQALVLACVSMLILALLVLATVNLTYAVQEKIQLQNASDAAAYSTAAYQARAMNFFAYTNRTMVVHYVSQMTLAAILSYMTFCTATFTAIAMVFSAVPGVGAVFNVIAQIAKFITRLFDVVISIFTPLVDGINYGIALSQTAVAYAMIARAATGSSAEVRAFNPAYRVVPLADAVDRLTSVKRWTDAVSSPGLNPFNRPTGAEEDTARLLMTEIANSGRPQWTVLGTKKISIMLIPRSLGTGTGNRFLVFKIGKFARTEWGSLRTNTSSTGFFSQFINTTERIYSIDEFVIELRLGWFGSIGFNMNAVVAADRRLGRHQASGGIFTKGVAGRLAEIAMAPFLRAARAAISAAIQQSGFADAGRHHFHFGMVPYARFRPSADASTLFRQMPVLVLVTQPTSDLVSRGRPFIQPINASLGLNSATSQLRNELGFATSAPPRRGYRNTLDFTPGDSPLGLSQGFHAISAALTYYHRPGDWREPPNLFNPFWGAKLMPVVDYPAIASFPLVANLFSQRLLTH
jgi:hypothetical protein